MTADGSSCTDSTTGLSRRAAALCREVRRLRPVPAAAPGRRHSHPASNRRRDGERTTAGKQRARSNRGETRAAVARASANSRRQSPASGGQRQGTREHEIRGQGTCGDRSKALSRRARARISAASVGGARRRDCALLGAAPTARLRSMPPALCPRPSRGRAGRGCEPGGPRACPRARAGRGGAPRTCHAPCLPRARRPCRAGAGRSRRGAVARGNAGAPRPRRLPGRRGHGSPWPRRLRMQSWMLYSQAGQRGGTSARVDSTVTWHCTCHVAAHTDRRLAHRRIIVPRPITCLHT